MGRQKITEFLPPPPPPNIVLYQTHERGMWLYSLKLSPGARELLQRFLKTSITSKVLNPHFVLSVSEKHHFILNKQGNVSGTKSNSSVSFGVHQHHLYMPPLFSVIRSVPDFQILFTSNMRRKCNPHLVHVLQGICTLTSHSLALNCFAHKITEVQLNFCHQQSHKTNPSSIQL